RGLLHHVRHVHLLDNAFERALSGPNQFLDLPHDLLLNLGRLQFIAALEAFILLDDFVGGLGDLLLFGLLEELALFTARLRRPVASGNRTARDSLLERAL